MVGLSPQYLIFKCMKKSTRFKIFERDSFTCQYCGIKPPDAVLEVDHMISKYDGGGDEEDNLITSCHKCNNGKSKKSITTKQRTKTQKQKLKELKEKANQLEAYYEFKKKSIDFEDSILQKTIEHWILASDHQEKLTKTGVKSMSKLLNRHSFGDIIDSIDIAFNKEIDPENRFKYFCGVLKNKKLEHDNPVKAQSIKEAHTFKFEIKNKLYYFNEKHYWKFINDGITIDEMREELHQAGNWTEFKDNILTKYYQ